MDNGIHRRFRSHDSRAASWLEILETHANLGFASGNNERIWLALVSDAKYIWLLNNDTTVEPQTLCALVAAEEADPSLGEIGSVPYYANRPDKVQGWSAGAISL